ncbi:MULTISPECIES: SseB family protein [Shewanella]|uniref:Enhanced serine sensitivity protein SseB n=2 Tax=Shewanella TaxID=22 RepID=A0ABX5WJ53_9GAMM|nr:MULTISPECIES: SseB family protein [Shewanella]QDF74269.1 enhanced serine sensitivity protein SseB [Shewanella marisflavi]
MEVTLTPSNALETALQAALADHTQAKALYEHLIKARLYLLSDGQDKPQADGTTELSIMQWHIPVSDGQVHYFVPIFTSQESVDQAKAVMEAEGSEFHGQIEIDAPQAFQLLLTNQMDMALNPNSNLSKVVSSDEIRYMLLPDMALLTQGNQLLLLGKVLASDLPMFGAVRALLAKYPSVKAGYFMESCELDIRRGGQNSVFTLALILEGDRISDDFSRIRSDCRHLHKEVELHGWEVRPYLLKTDKHDAISDYCLGKITPFYRPSLLSRFKTWISR